MVSIKILLGLSMLGMWTGPVFAVAVPPPVPATADMSPAIPEELTAAARVSLFPH